MPVTTVGYNGNNVSRNKPLESGKITDDLYLSNYKKPVKETGNSMLGKDAFLKLDLAETYAETVLKAKLLGEPRILTPEQVLAIERLKN